MHARCLHELSFRSGQGSRERREAKLQTAAWTTEPARRVTPCVTLRALNEVKSEPRDATIAHARCNCIETSSRSRSVCTPNIELAHPSRMCTARLKVVRLTPHSTHTTLTVGSQTRKALRRDSDSLRQHDHDRRRSVTSRHSHT